MASETIPSPEQVRAERSLPGWSQQDLAAKERVAISTITDFERGQHSPTPNNGLAIRQALEAAGVLFAETSVSHGFHWTFMTERGTSGFIITPPIGRTSNRLCVNLWQGRASKGLNPNNPVHNARTQEQGTRLRRSA